MKKVMKFLSLALISMLAITMMIGCGKTEPADTIAKAYYAAIANSDTTQLQTIGLSDDEAKQLVDTMKSAVVTSTKNNFKMNGLDISDDEAKQIVDAQYEAMKKLKATITVKSSDKQTSVVNISTTYLNLTDIDQKAANDAVAEVQAMGLTSQTEALAQLKDKYVANLLDGFKNAQPSTDTIEKDFSFTMQTVSANGKNQKMWQPENPTTFGKDLAQMITK